MRCSMCYLEREESKLRPVHPDYPVKVCGRDSMEIDKVIGFLETVGATILWPRPAAETAEAMKNGTNTAAKKAATSGSQ